MAENNKDNKALLSGIQDQGLGKPLAISAVFHLVLIAVFSIGYINLCMKYGTLKPKEAIEAEKEQKAQAELEEKRKQKAEKAAKEDAAGASKEVSDKTSEEKKVPKVIKETQEVIKDKPNQPSSLDSFDGDL